MESRRELNACSEQAAGNNKATTKHHRLHCGAPCAFFLAFADFRLGKRLAASLTFT
jgi:hypothetical protein